MISRSMIEFVMSLNLLGEFSSRPQLNFLILHYKNTRKILNILQPTHVGAEEKSTIFI